MAVKYSIPFFDDFNQGWRVDIDLPDYSGGIVELTGVGRVFCQPEWSAGDDPYEPIVNSKVTVQFYNRGGEVDVQELQLLPDMTGRLILYRGTDLWWTGYINPDGIQRMLQPMPYPITITATDGLAMLKDVPFSLGNNWPMPAGVSNRSPMSFIRYILYGFPSSPHLGITLPIRFQCDVENVEYSDSAIMGTISWGALGEAWTDFNGNSRTCMYILEGMLRSLQCRLIQFGGKWHIQRINDVVDGTYTWTELGTETGTAPTVTTGVSDMMAGISPTFYPMVNENQVASMKAAYTDVVATYEHYQAENVLPNGGFDRWLAGSLMYWGFEDIDDDSPFYLSHESLTGQGGEAVLLSNGEFFPATADAIFGLVGGLPMDTTLLFKRITLGFVVMPYNFPNVNGEADQQILWDSNPLKLQVEYVIPDNMGVQQRYYLNQYGFWIKGGAGGVFTLVNEGDDANGHFWVFTGTPLEGNSITFNWNDAVTGFTSYTFNITSATGGSLEDTLRAAMVGLGYSSNYTINIISPTEIGVSIPFNPDRTGWNTTTQAGIGVLPDLTIPIKVEGGFNYDVMSIVFRGLGGNNEILMPPAGLLDGNQDGNIGKLYVRFVIPPDIKYALDDVWVRVEENNDVYQSRIQDANRRSNRKTVDLNISSSFSGFMLSNLMTSYDKSNTEFRFTDGKYTGSLTGMTANAMMRYHHLPREIFEGDIYTNGRDWQANHIYLFDGKKYLPLVSRYNIETGVVTITAMECGDGENDFVEEHYGSNDLILSNT